jgi:hypothetical protein
VALQFRWCCLKVWPLSTLRIHPFTSTFSSPNSWQSFSVDFIATGSSTTIGLTGQTGVYYIRLDNVCVTAAVPEPETYAMLLAGLGLLGFISHRRKQETA